MDLVLVGLPGSGKTAVGRRLARRHEAAFVDLDELIEADASRAIPDIFAQEGEAGFRARERAAIAGLGAADPSLGLRRVIATGGGAPVDPRNRWVLYRGRLAAWLDGPPAVLAQRLRHSPVPRPLLAGRDPIAAMRGLATARARFYAPALRVEAVGGVGAIVDALEPWFQRPVPATTVLLRAETAVGHVELGEENAADGVRSALARLGARRAILVSEPNAWAAIGESISAALAHDGLPVERVLLPSGEAAKRLTIIEDAARDLARLRAERTDPIVAIGGGALGDAAGFLAATWLRGVPLIHVPTTLVAQIDSSIGGKTAVDLPDGKNLVGAFHLPSAVIADVSALRTLPPRHLRAALGEAVKMGALGDERLLEVLEEDGPALAAGDAAGFESGAMAEVVERCAWAKVEVVATDPREHGDRISLNLGHSAAHAIETVAAFERILHGEAVAYGLRAASRIGVASGVTPPERAARIEALLDRLDLARDPLPYQPADVLAAITTDKKHRGGRLRWVLPSASGWTVRSDVRDEDVAAAVSRVLAGRAAVVPGAPA